MCESSREDVIDSINMFVNPRGNQPAHCLIISYETFRLHAARLAVPGACDLLICDEVRPAAVSRTARVWQHNFGQEPYTQTLSPSDAF